MGRLPQLSKTKKIEKIEFASQSAAAAEQFQLVKKRKKVSWKRLDCQDELHKSMIYNKFATLTLGERIGSSTRISQISVVLALSH